MREVCLCYLHISKFILRQLCRDKFYLKNNIPTVSIPCNVFDVNLWNALLQRKKTKQGNNKHVRVFKIKIKMLL